MSFSDKISRIMELQVSISLHGKLPVEVLRKIDHKFRLEWNYHSNSMEGNTLTRQETRTVMVGNITIEGKPIRDVNEMHQHDKLIETIIKMGKGELQISEKRIKSIHAAIMYEEDEEKRKQVGEWKNEGNYLVNYKQERFDFVPPDEVPEKMHALINWLNAEKDKLEQGKKEALHPLVLASKFHFDYVTIHPFYDGNGRTARILTNIILISFGYPPIWVKTDEKDQYGRYLADIQAGGDADLFYDFMGGLMVRSQGIVLDAIAGKEIEEPEDLDKKLSILAKRLEMTDPKNEIVKHLNAEVFEDIYADWLGLLVERSIVLVQKFNKFFKESLHSITILPANIFVPFADEKVGGILTSLSAQLVKDGRWRLDSPEIRVVFQTRYTSFLKGGIKTFDCQYRWEVKMEKTKYVITMDEFSLDNKHGNKTVVEKLLHQPFSDAGIDDMIREFGETIYTHIIEHAKSIGIDLV